MCEMENQREITCVIPLQMEMTLSQMSLLLSYRSATKNLRYRDIYWGERQPPLWSLQLYTWIKKKAKYGPKCFPLLKTTLWWLYLGTLAFCHHRKHSSYSTHNKDIQHLMHRRPHQTNHKDIRPSNYPTLNYSNLFRQSCQRSHI